MRWFVTAKTRSFRLRYDFNISVRPEKLPGLLRRPDAELGLSVKR